MTGFTLGTDNGATLGTDNGGTLGIATTEWTIGGKPLPGVFDETATYRGLTLSFRIATDALIDRARTLKTNDNQISVLTTDDGGFTAIDRAGGENTYEVDVPAKREPLRQSGTYHVAEYEEGLVASPDVSEWNVTLELIRDSDRTDVPAIDQTAGSGEWAFDTRLGTIATQRVDAEFLGTGAEGVPRFQLAMRLTFEQAHVLEAAYGKLDGSRVRQIPDGDNAAVDETGGDVTVNITSPTPDVVDSGDYVVTSWESQRLNEGYQTVTLEVAKTQ